MMERREAITALLEDRGDVAIVTGLGSATYDVASVGDHPRNYYLWGAMGSSITVGLGLALARPDLDVVVVTGDGELLMGLGGLATIGVSAPENLCIVVLDNGHYGETGMQASHAGGSCDLVAVATACGFENAATIDTLAGLKHSKATLSARGTSRFMRVLIEANDPPRVLPSRDGVEVKLRFQKEIAEVS